MYCGANQTIQIKLGAAHTTNALPWASMAIDTAGAATAANGTTNGATAVTVVAATKGAMKTLFVRNADVIVQTLSVIYDDNGTPRLLLSAALAVGDTFELNSQGGVKVCDSNGAIRSTSFNNVAKLDYKGVFTKSQGLIEGALTSSSGAVTWDADAKPNATFTLTENVTAWTLNNLTQGYYYSLRLLQDASAAKTISWDSSKFKGMTGYTMFTALSGADHLVFRAVSTSVLELVGYRQGVQA
jgi:hypothetical protein